jgi:transposase
MAKGYLPVDRDQPFLLPPDMRQWLPASHPVWLVIEAVARLDTSAFHARRRTGGAGAAGYDPDMLVTLLIWAYANGVTSSRRIERLCGQDVAFRVICAGRAPDHVTVARFRQQFADTARDLFAQVLLLCARLGMGQVGTVALDGTKVAGNASLGANRTEEKLRELGRELAAAHAEADAAEDVLFGKGRRGDDDPGDPFTRAERVAAALASLEAEREAAEAEKRRRAQEAARTAQAVRAGAPVTGPRSGSEVVLARARLDRERAAYRAKLAGREARRAAGRPAGGMPPSPVEDYCRVRRALQALAKAEAREAARARRAAQGGDGKKGGKGKKAEPARRNVTDPGSRLMPVRGGGFIQGYNAQNVASEDGLVIATRLTATPNDVLWYQEMAAEAQAAAAAMAAAGGPGDGKIGLVLADAGYLSLANLACPGPDRLIATGKHRDRARAAARDAGPAGEAQETGKGAVEAMAARLATEEGTAAYRRRSHLGETFHGDLKHNQGIRRLSLRGHRKASGEWTFAAAARNLRKAITSGHLTTESLAALPC